METLYRVYETAGVFFADCVIALIIMQYGLAEDGIEPLLRESLLRGVCGCRMVINSLILKDGEEKAERTDLLCKYLSQENPEENEEDWEAKAEEVLDGLSLALLELEKFSRDKEKIEEKKIFSVLEKIWPLIPRIWKTTLEASLKDLQICGTT